MIVERLRMYLKEMISLSEIIFLISKRTFSHFILTTTFTRNSLNASAHFNSHSILSLLRSFNVPIIHKPIITPELGQRHPLRGPTLASNICYRVGKIDVEAATERSDELYSLPKAYRRFWTRQIERIIYFWVIGF